MKSLATGNSSFSTFFQMAPHLVSVLKHMQPTWHLASLSQIDRAFLAGHDIRALIWDVDGTLTGDRKTKLDPRAAPGFLELMAMPKLKHVVLSNAGEPRFVQLGSVLPELPILRAYTMGAEVLYRRRLANFDTWTPQEVERRIADGAQVIRKPSKVLVDHAAAELGVPKKNIVMIGDQYLTDIAGANLGGVRSVKLPTLARETFRTSVRFSQRLELAIYTILHGRAVVTT